MCVHTYIHTKYVYIYKYQTVQLSETVIQYKILRYKMAAPVLFVHFLTRSTCICGYVEAQWRRSDAHSSYTVYAEGSPLRFEQ